MKSKKKLYKIAKEKGVSLKNIQELLLYHLQISKEKLFFLDYIEDNDYFKINNDITKLASGYPIAYLVYSADFYGQSFYVNDSVLIPRYDTEVLVKTVMSLDQVGKYELIDIGTGSGIIPITLLKNTNLCRAYALDISSKALEVANINIKKFNLENNIKTLYSNLLEEIINTNNISFKSTKIIITANLPYIKDFDFENMQKETYSYEPDLALYGGEKDGFDLYRKLFKEVKIFGKKFKLKEVKLFIEIGFNQLEIAKNEIINYGLPYEIYFDNSGIARVIKITFLF